MKRQISNQQYVQYVACGAVVLILLFSPVPGLAEVGAISVIAMIYHFKSSIFNFKHPLIPIVFVLLILGIGLLVNQQSTKLEPLRKDMFLILCMIVVYCAYFIGAIAGYFELRKKGIIENESN